jgi:dynein heavy chain
MNICRGLFEKDKLLYAFLKASSISKRAGDISTEEWNIYLRGTTTDFSSFKNPYDYINQATFQKLMGLEEAHVNFQGISKSFGDPAHEPVWR